MVRQGWTPDNGRPPLFHAGYRVNTGLAISDLVPDNGERGVNDLMRQLKPMLLLVCALLLPSAGTTARAANKEHEQMQRDLNLLNEELRRLPTMLAPEFAAIKAMVTQSINASDKAQNSVLVLETRMTERMQSLEKSLAQTVASLNARVDSMSTEFQGIKEESKETNARLAKMSTKLDDLMALMKIIQTTPKECAPAPGVGDAPKAEGGPPPGPGGIGFDSNKLFEDADRDRMAGKTDLAIKGYRDFLRNSPKSERSCEAQFRVGEMLMRKGEVFPAAAEFDMVIERYDPTCRFQPEARYMKGRAFVKADQPSAAKDEFRRLAEDYKGTEWERKAKEALKEIGFSAAPPKPAAKAAPKKRPAR